MLRYGSNNWDLEGGLKEEKGKSGKGRVTATGERLGSAGGASAACRRT